MRAISCHNIIASLAIAGMGLLPAQVVLGAPLPQLEISMPGDTNMSCHALSSEITSMDQVISEALAAKNESRTTSTGIGVAKTVGGILVGSLGGAIGIMAAGHLLSSATDDETASADALQDIAEQRRSLITGIFTTKKCQGPRPAPLRDRAAATKTAAVAPDLANTEPAAGGATAGYND